MLRWGILSTAKIGIEQVIPAHMEADNGVVIAIASRSKSKAAELAKRFGIPKAYSSYEDLLSDKNVDAIYIPLPTSQHIEWSLKAAKAGKHVLCEKPISLHAKEIKALQKAAAKNKVIISEAFMVTYHPQWEKVRDLIKDGAIGKLRQVQGAFSYFNKDPKNMRNIAELGGGALPDIGVYPTITTRFATGTEPKRVKADVTFDKKFKTDIYANVRADFGDFELSFYLSTQLALRQYMGFHGDKGFIELSAPFNTGLYDFSRVMLHSQKHDEVQEFKFGGVNHYKLQAEAFGRAVLSGRKADKQKLVSLESSISNQKLIDAVYRAAKHDKWEKV
jgi:predicted dehydrogenase